MEIERKRPMKVFRVIQAFGPYSKGARIQPTGMYRDVLVRRGLIEEIIEPIDDAVSRVVQPEHDRMVRLPEKTEGRPILHLRKKGQR